MVPRDHRAGTGAPRSGQSRLRRQDRALDARRSRDRRGAVCVAAAARGRGVHRARRHGPAAPLRSSTACTSITRATRTSSSTTAASRSRSSGPTSVRGFARRRAARARRGGGRDLFAYPDRFPAEWKAFRRAAPHGARRADPRRAVRAARPDALLTSAACARCAGRVRRAAAGLARLARASRSSTPSRRWPTRRSPRASRNRSRPPATSPAAAPSGPASAPTA